MSEAAVRRIGIVLFPDAEELDAVGPWEVLSSWCHHYPEDGWAVTTLSLGRPRHLRQRSRRPGAPLVRRLPAARRHGCEVSYELHALTWHQ